MEMEIRQLKYFVSAATHLNFTKAAKECYIVQSSMTAQIANLEEELGVKLFDRLPRGLALTDGGKFFLSRAKILIQEAQRTEAEMSAFQAGYRSLLRIGYQGELLKGDMVDILRRYRREEPFVKVILHQMSRSMMMESLRDGLLDLVFTACDNPFLGEGWLEMETILEDGPCLVVGKDHPLAERESVTLAEIQGLTYVSLGRDRESVLYRIFPEETLRRIYIAGVDHTSAEILVASGYGVGLWGERLRKGDRYPALRFIPISDPPGKKKYALAWRKGRLTPEGERFRSVTRELMMEDG